MTRALCSLLALAACGSGAREAPSPIANNAATTVQQLGDTTLALFAPINEHCQLRRVDAITGQFVALAEFENRCAGARIAWRADLARAVVWFDPGNRLAADPEIEDRLFDVDIAHRAATRFEPAYDAHEIGYAGDDLVAFTINEFPAAKGSTVTYLGQALDFTNTQDGIPAAAVAHVRRAHGWTVVDVTATTTGWDYAMGWAASPTAKKLGPRSIGLLEPHTALTVVNDIPSHVALEKIAPSDPSGDRWGEMATPHGPIYVWESVGEFTSTTGRIAWQTSSGVALLDSADLRRNEQLVALIVSGHYLLISDASSGANARLYDLVERRLVYTAPPGSRATTMWPR
jgi:hypothetical protein